MNPRNILALDLGSKTGVCWNIGEERFCRTWRLATAKEIAENRRTRMDRRCDPRVISLFTQLYKMRDIGLDVVLFEDVQFASTSMQAHLWASFRAAVWIAFLGTPVYMDCVPVGTLKLFATGRGNADKKDMARVLAGRPEFAGLDDNAVDAYHLWRWGQHNLGTIPRKTGGAQA